MLRTIQYVGSEVLLTALAVGALAGSVVVVDHVAEEYGRREVRQLEAAVSNLARRTTRAQRVLKEHAPSDDRSP